MQLSRRAQRVPEKIGDSVSSTSSAFFDWRLRFPSPSRAMTPVLSFTPALHASNRLRIAALFAIWLAGTSGFACQTRPGLKRVH
jgi:hypothetical protein